MELTITLKGANGTWDTSISEVTTVTWVSAGAEALLEVMHHDNDFDTFVGRHVVRVARRY